MERNNTFWNGEEKKLKNTQDEYYKRDVIPENKVSLFIFLVVHLLENFLIYRIDPDLI